MLKIIDFIQNMIIFLLLIMLNLDIPLMSKKNE